MIDATTHLDELYARWLDAQTNERAAALLLGADDGDVAKRALYEQRVEIAEAAKADYVAACDAASAVPRPLTSV